LQCVAVCCNTLQHTATHCNTLQHTATHCNTLHWLPQPTLAAMWLRWFAVPPERASIFEYLSLHPSSQSLIELWEDGVLKKYLWDVCGFPLVRGYVTVSQCGSAVGNWRWLALSMYIFQLFKCNNLSFESTRLENRKVPQANSKLFARSKNWQWKRWWNGNNPRTAPNNSMRKSACGRMVK